MSCLIKFLSVILFVQFLSNGVDCHQNDVGKNTGQGSIIIQRVKRQGVYSELPGVGDLQPSVYPTFNNQPQNANTNKGACDNGSKPPYCCDNGSTSPYCCDNNSDSPYCCSNNSKSPYCCANESTSPFCCANNSVNENCSP